VGKLEATTLVIRLAIAAGVVAALLWFVIRPLIRTWRQQPDPERLMPKLPTLPEEELQIPVDPRDRAKPKRKEIIEQARADPRQTALVLQQWIREKKRERPR
jgi:flagellar biosynthesis/type III secretory pathway M-ring protein FliF/YscJ